MATKKKTKKASKKSTTKKSTKGTAKAKGKNKKVDKKKKKKDDGEQKDFTTPFGKANYPWLHIADKQFDKDGEYKVNLIVPIKEGKALAKMIKERDEANYEATQSKNKKDKRQPVPYTVDKEEGVIEFKFKQKALIKTKDGDEFPKTVAMFDAKGKPMKAAVGRGSEIKVNFSFYEYMHKVHGAGVQLRLNAVQVKELVEWRDGKDADSYGFGEEDGFEADETTEWDEDDAPEEDDDDEMDDVEDDDDSDEDDDDEEEEDDEDDIPF